MMHKLALANGRARAGSGAVRKAVCVCKIATQSMLNCRAIAERRRATPAARDYQMRLIAIIVRAAN